MKKFVVFGAGLVLGGAIGYFGSKKLDEIKKAKRVAERRTYPQYNYSYRYVSDVPTAYKDVRFDNKLDAEEVLRRLEELVGKYGQVTIANFYDAAEEVLKDALNGAHFDRSYRDYAYGWTDPHIEYTGIKLSYGAGDETDGWYIDFLRPVRLK